VDISSAAKTLEGREQAVKARKKSTENIENIFCIFILGQQRAIIAKNKLLSNLADGPDIVYNLAINYGEYMNADQLQKIREGKGFIAALDQSGGSTPKALKLYGIEESEYSGEEEMFDLVHQMRARIVSSPVFTGERIIGAILFEMTMDRDVNGVPTAAYLWGQKQVVPFLKIDKGLTDEENGVQIMKPNPGLGELLQRANQKGIFGTKMRSVIKLANPEGIKAVVSQQFETARQIIDAGLVPIVEPEVDINSSEKAEAEEILWTEIAKHIDKLGENDVIMLKLTLPEQAGFYQQFVDSPKVARVVALSGGYSREEANAKLAENQGVVASFSRALTEGLNANQTDEEFNNTLDASIESIYQASVNKN
jgi:fructose-bisphosphate aldolase class I